MPLETQASAVEVSRMTFEVPVNVRKMLEAMSEVDRRSMTGQIVWLIEAEHDRRERPTEDSA